MEITEQQDEIEVLKSIFDESVLIIQNGEIPRGTIEIHPLLPESFQILTQTKISAPEEQKLNVKLKFLPPMNLYFKFEKTYPETTCPAYLLTSKWLTSQQLRKLCQKLDSIWEECKPEVVLYRWILFLQEEALQFLKIEETLDISQLLFYQSEPIQIQFSPPQKRKEISVRGKTARKMNNEVGNSSSSKQSDSDQINELVKSDNASFSDVNELEAANNQITESTKETPSDERDHNCENTIYFPQIENSQEDPNCDSRSVFIPTNGEDLQSYIIRYNDSRIQMELEKEWFICKVCFIDKQGFNGMRFHFCNHIFCKDCLQSYFTVQIQEGNVRGLTCLENKCESQALPHQVRELIGNDLYLRYDKILLESSLSQMKDITVCPLQSCQCSIILDQDSKCASCPACGFAFCVSCRKTYHGVVPCRLHDEEVEAIVDEYFKADDEEKEEVETKYAMKYTRKYFKFIKNEHLSNEWIKNWSKKCPSCFAPIQKSEGCNKMVCLKCNTYFCWICRTTLSKFAPYKHFEDPNFPSCYNKVIGNP